MPEPHDEQTQLESARALRHAPLGVLLLDERREGESIRVTPVGELDIATGAELSERLRELGSDGIPTVLDLSRVGFVDCSGLRAVVEAVQEAERRPSRLELAPDYSQPMRRLLELIDSPQLADQLRGSASE